MAYRILPIARGNVGVRGASLVIRLLALLGHFLLGLRLPLLFLLGLAAAAVLGLDGLNLGLELVVVSTPIIFPSCIPLRAV